jgi:plasmid stability protein
MLAGYASGLVAATGVVLLFGAAEHTVGSVALGVGLVAAGAFGLYWLVRAHLPRTGRATTVRAQNTGPAINHRRVASKSRALVIKELSLEALPSGEWAATIDGCRVEFSGGGRGATVRVKLPRLLPLHVPSRWDLGHGPFSEVQPLVPSLGQVILTGPGLPAKRILCAEPKAEAWTAALTQLPAGMLERLFERMETRLHFDHLSLAADPTGWDDGERHGRSVVEHVREVLQFASWLCETSDRLAGRPRPGS